MTHLEDVAERLAEHDAQLGELVGRFDAMDKRMKEVDRRAKSTEKAVTLIGDEFKLLRDALYEDQNRDSAVLTRVEALERAASAATKATAAPVPVGAGPAATGRGGAGGGGGGGGSSNSGGASATLAPPTTVVFARTTFPEQEEVRERVRELALATQGVTDMGTAPAKFRGARFPKEGEPGASVAIENTPRGWDLSKVEIDIDGINTKTKWGGNRIDFQIPSSVGREKVVHVVIRVPNIGRRFQFPLTIKRPWTKT